jgi:outer membrane protein OmpA-like peptidoglycan-associated protein/tetratricopeptide (TPR) repeat protein
MNNKFALLLSFILLPALLLAQNRIKQADEYFNNFDFLRAISKYEKVVKKDSSNTYAMYQIASAYRMIGKDQLASDWLKLILDREPTNLESRFYYALTKLSKGEYSEAMDQFLIYYSLDSANLRVNEYVDMPDFETILKQDSANFIVDTLDINSDKSDYGPAIVKNYLVFTSSRDREVAIKRKNTWSDEPFLDIYRSELFSDGTLGEALIIGEPITTKFHEGSSSYDVMTDKLYFTRTGFYENELSTDDQGITNIEIFTSSYDVDNDKWLEISPFPYNNKQYSVAQPSISADSKTLYFVSDMPGGLGGTDIYVCFWNGAGWTEPQNLGRPVNTEGHEKNPYIDKDGTLYFASKGHVGLGGLDIYYAEPNSKGFDTPINMGYPVNTRFDDFSFTFTDDSKTAFYFASNRDGGVGDDDIYLINIKPEEPIILAGSVIIKESLKDTPIKMLITDDEGNLLASDTISKSRPFELPIIETEKPWNMVFYPLFEMNALESKQGIDPATASNGVLNVGEIVLGEDLPEDELDVEGTLVIADDGQDPTKDTDQGKVEYIDMPSLEQGIDMQFDPVYFGFDKTNLSTEAKSQLDQLVKLMTNDKEATVEISGHTDSRGSKTYNLKLSERRTSSALNYLISKGIDASRITTVNHGELQLVNQCDDGVDCTKEEHAKNRRVELKINKPSS